MDSLRQVLATLPQGVELVAVSKYHPAEAIAQAYADGQRIFGESHEQELAAKHEQLPKDIEWHFIGHLQTNKVRFIVPYVAMIEAVDSTRLMREIDKRAKAIGRRIDILLELHIAQEATKYGFTTDECRAMLASGEWKQMEGLRIRGLMMMATYTDDTRQIEQEMNRAAECFRQLKADFFPDDDSFNIRSWGMSHDYNIAVRCQSNMVRVGTKIFGERQYK